MLAAVGIVASVLGIATVVVGRPAAEPPRGRDGTQWGAQINALMSATLYEVALARQVARSATRPTLRREAARMQLDAQQTLLRLDTEHRRLPGTPPTAARGHLAIRGPGPGRDQVRHRPPRGDDRRLAALIAARVRAAALATNAAGNPVLRGNEALGRSARADRDAAVRLEGWRARWFG